MRYSIVMNRSLAPALWLWLYRYSSVTQFQLSVLYVNFALSPAFWAEYHKVFYDCIFSYFYSCFFLANRAMNPSAFVNHNLPTYSLPPLPFSCLHTACFLGTTHSHHDSCKCGLSPLRRCTGGGVLCRVGLLCQGSYLYKIACRRVVSSSVSSYNHRLFCICRWNIKFFHHTYNS